MISRSPLRVPPRALPPAPNGGDQDIRDLTRGSWMFYPVFVEGANFSVGDLHHAQGDREITLCGAIGMGGWVELHVDLIPGGMATYRIDEHPVFVPGDGAPRYEDWVSFSGISVTEKDGQRYLNPYLAYQRACLNVIDYLTSFGYAREQAYLLLGAAPIEAHLSSVVDIPNACATLYLPTGIFDFDIRPTTSGPHQVSPDMQPPRADAAELADADILRAVPKDKKALLPAARRLGGQAAQPASAAFGKLRQLLGRRGS